MLPRFIGGKARDDKLNACTIACDMICTYLVSKVTQLKYTSQVHYSSGGSNPSPVGILDSVYRADPDLRIRKFSLHCRTTSHNVTLSVSLYYKNMCTNGMLEC